MTEDKTGDSLGAIIKQIQGQKHPPVHLWNPEFCGDLDMRIARDGTWFYLGSSALRSAENRWSGCFPASFAMMMTKNITL